MTSSWFTQVSIPIRTSRSSSRLAWCAGGQLAAVGDGERAEAGQWTHRLGSNFAGGTRRGRDNDLDPKGVTSCSGTRSQVMDHQFWRDSKDINASQGNQRCIPDGGGQDLNWANVLHPSKGSRETRWPAGCRKEVLALSSWPRGWRRSPCHWVRRLQTLHYRKCSNGLSSSTKRCKQVEKEQKFGGEREKAGEGRTWGGEAVE